MKIHPVFHISLLEPYKSSLIPGRIIPPPPPVEVMTDTEWEVESILDSKYLRSRLLYFVKWKGYPISDNSWEPAVNLENSPILISKFHRLYPSKPGPGPPAKVTFLETEIPYSQTRIPHPILIYAIFRTSILTNLHSILPFYSQHCVASIL